MAMKLSEIDRADEEKRERAWRFEKLSDEKSRLTKSIERLTATAKTTDTTTLRKMHAMCGDLPRDLTTTGTQFIAGGFQARDVLMVVIGGALDEVQRKADATEAALTKARADLVKIDKLLQEFK